MSKVSVLTFYLCILVLSSSCVSVEFRETEPKYFASLNSRQLSSFERRVTIDVHDGTIKGRTKLGLLWLAFANCEPLPKTTFLDPTFQFAAYTLRVEEARRHLFLFQQKGRPSFGTTLGADILEPDFFNRKPKHEMAAMTWLPEDEHWPDETPAPIFVSSKCISYRAKVADETSVKVNNNTIQKIETSYFETIQDVNSSAEKIQELDRNGGIAKSIFLTNLEGIRYFSSRRRSLAVRVQRLRTQRESSDLTDENLSVVLKATNIMLFRIDAYNKKIVYFAENLQKLVPDEEKAFRDNELLVARTALAMIAIENEKYEEAKNILSKLESSFHDAQYAWLSKYLKLRVLSALGEYKKITKEFEIHVPPTRSKYFGPYTYRLATAFKEAGDEERFLGIVKTAFRDKTYKSNPFLRALYFELLRSLASVSFDTTVVEILEEIGPRGETFERVEQLARMALDMGYPENADAAASYLLVHHKNAKFHPRYYAIRALAAFQQDDEHLFNKMVYKIIYRPKDLVDAIEKSRRPVFFEHADVELARILQRIIPEMAEWGESKSAEIRRQHWLETIVKSAQDFLRNDRDSLLRHPLLEVYRLASGLLKSDPRGYAERVGESKLRPMILGRVTLESNELKAHEPGIDLGIRIVYSLALIPDDKPVYQWGHEWMTQNEIGARVE